MQEDRKVARFLDLEPPTLSPVPGSIHKCPQSSSHVPSMLAEFPTGGGVREGPFAEWGGR